MTLATSRSCSWCHTKNFTEARYCKQCGHEAHKPRLFCQCRYCETCKELHAQGTSELDVTA